MTEYVEVARAEKERSEVALRIRRSAPLNVRSPLLHAERGARTRLLRRARRSLKRRLSNTIYRRMLADQQRRQLEAA